MTDLVLDTTFKGENYSITRLPKAEYENCIFENCNFSKANLSNSTFSECEFIDCDISNATLAEVTLKETLFKDCKLLGVNFQYCNTFILSFSFEN